MHAAHNSLQSVELGLNRFIAFLKMGSYMSLHCRESCNQISYFVLPTSILVKQVGMHHLDRLVWLNQRNGLHKSGERGDDTVMHHKPEKTCTQDDQCQCNYQPMLKISECSKGNICRTLNHHRPASLWNRY